jgi:hypothetical protein
MATNPPKGDNHRHGAVTNRSQAWNPHTQRWVKRDSGSGQLMDMKSNPKPFKGVRKAK